VDHYTTVRLRKDGQPIDVSQTLSPIRDAADNIRGASVIARDITEENHLREQLDAIARERAEDLSRYATSIQHVQEDERRRIARELHDDFGQRLTGLKLKVEVFEDDVPDLPSGQSDALKRIKGDIDAMITEVRRISANLRPVALDDFGLVVALQLLCKEFQKSSGTKVDFRANPVEHLDADIEITLYRIAQEALANVARHAAATSVSIQLFNEESGINLVIEDNGKGFDTANLRLHEKTYRGFGLISMRERAQLLGGSVYFSSQKGRGTRIHVEIPPGREHDDETNQDHHRG
jgi:signal transduction histidine kinase